MKDPDATPDNAEPITGKTLRKNIQTVLALEKKSMDRLSAVEHIADKVTRFAGSTPFIIFHLLWFGCWIIINTGLIPAVKSFDPYPFSFLTLVVSLEAIFLTLLVLMTQNSMTKEADKRAKLDLQINLLDEQETTIILRMVQKISSHLGIEDEIDDAVSDLCEQTDVMTLAKSLEETEVK